MANSGEEAKIRLTEAIAAVEAGTGAEVVVVQARRSDSWWELRFGLGAALGWGAVAILCWSPLTFHDLMIPIYAAATGLLGVAIGGTRLVVRQAPERVRRARVELAARAAFVEEAVHTTPDRTGLLVYVSELEGLGMVIADEGVLARLPTIGTFVVTTDTLAEDLSRLAPLLADALPRRADDVNHLPDAPRVRR